MFELGQQRLQFFERTLVLFSKLKEHSGVIQLRLEQFLSFNFFFEPTTFLQQLLRGFLVAPEIRRGGLRFDTVQLFAARRNIKETSRVELRARGGRRKRFLIPGSITSHSSLLSQTPSTAKQDREENQDRYAHANVNEKIAVARIERAHAR